MSEMDEIIKEFLVESNDNLDQLDRDLVELEKEPDSSELLARIFRAIHTVKGTSGVLGFGKLESVAHVGESLLSRMRDGKLRLNSKIATGLLKMVDALREVLQSIDSTGGEGDGDYSSVIAQLKQLLESALEERTPLGQILVEKTEQAVQEALAAQHAGDGRKLGEILVERGAVSPDILNEALRLQQSEAGSHVSGSSIRVDVNLLDKLMNLVGELVLARNQILQFTGTETDSAFLGTAQRLNLITTELQEGVMKTRMQPIGNVWSKFPRVVRDLAAQLGKQVRIEMEGTETELDKTIIEAIKDPLTHIVRNSVDHGIEMPEERNASGKCEEGRLTLRAFHEGGQVNIEIHDDGRGIDLERLKQKALERGQISAEQTARMSEREALNLIFRPGLSTAQSVTNISGRGVGMDVVKTNIEKIGGTVDVHTVKGEGTTLKIKIPLTLAIILALIATSGCERFAIPQVSLLELVRLEGEQAEQGIERIHGAPVYRLRGNLLPLVYLNQQLELGNSAHGDAVNIVVLQADDRQFGLVVDEINDTEEIVVKPLGKQFKGLSCFAGATIMGDGKVALILDVLGIAQMSSVVTEVRERAALETEHRATDSAVGRDAWLVFQVGRSRRMAIPLSAVSRLEEFPAKMIEPSGSDWVVQYRGQIMTLIDIAQELDGENATEKQQTLQVIVYSKQGRSVGLIVDQIVDIVEEAVAMESDEVKSDRVGSAVIQGRVTDLLNVEALMKNPNLQEARR
ncbi:MAG TPA: chemotaxis protein CheW [Terriglobales bacterium]|nr:chemotaxis protein CheW [Terriglobales bacterium]